MELFVFSIKKLYSFVKESLENIEGKPHYSVTNILNFVFSSSLFPQLHLAIPL